MKQNSLIYKASRAWHLMPRLVYAVAMVMVISYHLKDRAAWPNLVFTSLLFSLSLTPPDTKNLLVIYHAQNFISHLWFDSITLFYVHRIGCEISLHLFKKFVDIFDELNSCRIFLHNKFHWCEWGRAFNLYKHYMQLSNLASNRLFIHQFLWMEKLRNMAGKAQNSKIENGKEIAWLKCQKSLLILGRQRECFD